MRLFENETVLWSNEDKHLCLTTHRLRYEKRSVRGGQIQSIMLENIQSCEMKPHFLWKPLWNALLWFVSLNVGVFVLNNYLFQAKLVTLFFGEVALGSPWVEIIFYLSMAAVGFYVWEFFRSIYKVFSFHAVGVSINIRYRWINQEDRESFISRVEEARMKRIQTMR